MSSPDAAVVVDSRGTLCPQPVIDLAQAATQYGPGTLLRLIADDPAAIHDVPAWCRMRGHTLEHTDDDDRAALVFDVRL